MPSTADTALHELVAELAMTTPEDMAAVLDLLDARSAGRVRALLAVQAGIAASRSGTAADTSGLSDWLAARVQGKVSEVDPYHMTPAALAALRALMVSPTALSLTARPRGEASGGPIRSTSSQRSSA